MPVTLGDERPHADGPEAWTLAFAAADGTAGRVATTVEAGRLRISVLVLRPGSGPVVVRDDLPVRGAPFEVRGDGIWVNQYCETPFEHWTYGLEAFAVELDQPHDAWTGERGTRLPVGWDLEWEAQGAPFDTGAGYAQPGTVTGELLLADATLSVAACGIRAHWWGSGSAQPRLWWHDDHGDVFVLGNRAVRWSTQEPRVLDVRGYSSEVDTRGFATRVDVTLGADESSFGIEPFAWAGEIVSEDPLRVLPHAAVRVQRDGVPIGVGWQEGVAAS